MRRPIYAAVLFLGLVASTGAFAFGTVSIMGQNREHERITRHALACGVAHVANCFEADSIDNLAGKKGTFGAVGAPDNPTRGLLSTSAAHCDNGDFLPGISGYAHTQQEAEKTLRSCRTFMDKNLDAAVRDAAAMLLPDGSIDDSQMPTVVSCTFNGKKGRAKCNVLEDFGLTLHSAQDFYAHTNWADLPDPARPVGITNPPGLGNEVPAPWLNLRRAALKLPAGLMSGCFQSVPEKLFCNDGPGGRVKHAYLNKDDGTIDPAIGQGTTERGRVNDNFGRAVRDAIADSQDKWAILQERLMRTYPETGARMICALTHDDPKRNCR